MKQFNRSVACAAGTGLSVLLLFTAFGQPGVARAQNTRMEGSKPTVEPTRDTFAGPPRTVGTDASKTPQEAIRDWPDGARATAQAMIAKYGQPTRFSDSSLVWIGNGPWEKTVVYRSAWPHLMGKDKDYLEQTVAYRVPANKIEDLKRFDSRLKVDESRSRLSSRSESEPLNFLALNLADEIVTDKRSVKDARDFYRRTARLAESGKSSRYTSGLMFSSRSGEVGPAAPVREIEP